jgi:hypothetical protein
MKTEENYVTEKVDICARAQTKLGGIDVTRRFPRNVFVGDWADFFFFDSDWMFDTVFVQIVKSLLEVEHAACACLANLDTPQNGDRGEGRVFFLTRETTGETYGSLLKGTGAGNGWIYDIDRFGCTSDVGDWCMYCERNNEIAVVAIRRNVAVGSYVSVLAKCKAMRIDDAIRQNHSYGFSEKALAPQWCSEFLQEYAAR